MRVEKPWFFPLSLPVGRDAYGKIVKELAKNLFPYFHYFSVYRIFMSYNVKKYKYFSFYDVKCQKASQNAVVHMKIGDILDETDVEDIPELIKVLRSHLESTWSDFVTSRAFFKAKVGESGRVTIPTAEREVLGIKEGDVVQVIVRPIKDDGDPHD